MGSLWQDLSVCTKNFDLYVDLVFLTYFWKNLTLAITFEPKEIGLSYYRYEFLVARPICLYQKFWSCAIDFWPFEKNLTFAVSFEPKKKEYSYYMPYGKFFLSVPKFSTHDLDFNFLPNFEKLKMPNYN